MPLLPLMRTLGPCGRPTELNCGWATSCSSPPSRAALSGMISLGKPADPLGLLPSSALDRHQWGLWCGDGLASLGADLGLLSETGLSTEAQHSLACHGLSAKGFCAISHGRPATAPQAYRAGVLLAVRAGYPGQWTHVAKDTAGRALAATLLGETGLAVRVVVVYAPVGACSPGFAHTSLAPAEADLKLFVDAQISLCTANSMALIIGGFFHFCRLGFLEGDVRG